MESEQKNYIPAGCLRISREDSNIEPEFWLRKELQNWNYFASDDLSADEAGLHPSRLLPDVQNALFKAPILKRYRTLFGRKWIRLEFATHTDNSEFGTLRVYLLPDDVLRRDVDRSQSGLRAYRHAVINSLDYSKQAWNGNHRGPRLERPVSFQDPDLLEDEQIDSLLWLFNKIPSPEPNPEFVFEQNTRDIMYDLLDSNVPGLTTLLYPYQRRSAALMLQKEAQPQRILDPRFRHVTDQQGRGWFLDPVEGGLLKESRWYDGVSGGILAEEMGAGKTIICLALILATKDLPTKAPEIYGSGAMPTRNRIASLADMAASCATRNAVPWKPYFNMYKKQFGEDFAHCIEALERNPPYYFQPRPKHQRTMRNRNISQDSPPTKIYLSSGSVIVVPNNLVAQWKQEIRKHTHGLKVFIVTKGVQVPQENILAQYDLILFSQTRFEWLVKEDGGIKESPLYRVHFKRCIVDEGHKLGNSKISRKSNLLIGLDEMKFSSRWIVTGTPSHGLFGVDIEADTAVNSPLDSPPAKLDQTNGTNGLHAKESANEMEKKDLERIGSIATLFLKVRPWANDTYEQGDVPADWTVYLMLPKHSSKGRGSWDCLRSTLNSLIIRHQLSDVGDLLPPVDHKIVALDGSYQDQLSLNIFSMMIIFNSVQSQRTDMDYFFHPKQKRSLLQIVHNLKQTCFFGGSFFTREEIAKAVETAEKFLEEKKIPISAEDETLLRQAVETGHLAMDNKLRNLSNQFHEMPVSVRDFPSSAGSSWSLDGEAGDTVCSSASMILALQKLIFKSSADPAALNSLLNGQLIEKGMEEREKILSTQSTDKEPSGKTKTSQTLAGNTKLGVDSPKKTRSHGVNRIDVEERMSTDTFLGPLESTKITSTVSSKLSYLIDSIIKYQDEEKIIVFYENENVAWYLASMLDVLRVQHLIYAKGLTTDRRAQYVNTFNHNSAFRVLLMDISQAAFGLDMREASRIYFINPVLNPQVEAQAIGRARRISQHKPVSVETLVLRNSIEEVILERKQHMTQAEHRQVKSILDVRPVYDWIKNAKITPLPQGDLDNDDQMTPLKSPQFVFGRGFGKVAHPDDGLVMDLSPKTKRGMEIHVKFPGEMNGRKRVHELGPGEVPPECQVDEQSTPDQLELATRPARRVRFA